MNYRKFYVLITVVITYFFSGCISAEIKNYKDPSYVGKTFKRVVVEFVSEDVGLREKFEEGIVEEFKRYGIFAVSLVKIVPPTREINENLKKSIIQVHNIDSWLVIKFLTSKKTTTTSVTNNPGYGYNSAFGGNYGTGYGGAYGGAGGYSTSTITSQKNNFRNELYDVKNNQCALLSMCYIHSDAPGGGYDFNDIIDEAAKSIVENYIDKTKAGVFVPTKVPD